MPPSFWNDSFVTAPCLLTSKQFLVVTGLNIPKRRKANIRPFGFGFFQEQVCASCDLSPLHLLISYKARREGQKWEKWNCLPNFENWNRQEHGWKETTSTWVTLESCSGTSAAEMGMWIKVVLLFPPAFCCSLFTSKQIWYLRVSFVIPGHLQAIKHFPESKIRFILCGQEV